MMSLPVVMLLLARVAIAEGPSCDEPTFFLETPTYGTAMIQLTEFFWDRQLMKAFEAINYDENAGYVSLPSIIGVEGLSLKVTGTGVQDTTSCARATGIILAMLITNVAKSFPMQSIHTPAKADCPDPPCRGRNCLNSMADIDTLVDSECGPIRDSCTCTPAFDSTWVDIPTTASVVVGARKSDGGVRGQTNVGYELSVHKSCGFDGSALIDMLFTISAHLVPFLGMEVAAAERAASAIEQAADGNDIITKFRARPDDSCN